MEAKTYDKGARFWEFKKYMARFWEFKKYIASIC
jgi:hypothetical protein